jgi:leucyl-tRNA synthetase
MTTEEAIPAIVEKLQKTGYGKLTTMFRLRDWLISRQRYWGAPIPVIHCPICGAVAVPESDLPVRLPENVEFRPDGESPLKRCAEFMHTKCPKCGMDATRDPDTMDTFVDSSWYFLRYPDNKNDKEVFNKDKINRLLPVDKYVGGQEHATMHLLYARFFTKALRDMGYLDFDEPFTSLVHQGMILGTDGQKMSKSKGNTINPDDSISKYGSDVFRMFLEFAFAYTDGGPWNENGVESMARFVKRIETLIEKAQNMDSSVNEMTANEKKLDFIRNTTIGAVTKDMDVMQFNTSLARMMEYLNALNDYVSGPVNKEFLMDCIKTFVLLLAPFAPHLGEELWEKLGHPYSVFNQQWPKVNESALVKDEMKIVIQTNGKLRGTFEVAKTTDKDTIIQMAKDQIKDFLQDKEIVKEIYVPGRLVNLVVK